MGEDLEARLGGLLRGGALAEAAGAALEEYSPELFAFLVNLLSTRDAASEVFSQVAEDFWRGLPAFAGRCTVRTWLYVLARHAAARYRRSPWNRDARTGDAELDALVAAARSRTDPWLRSEVKERWRVLRESMDPDDRTLLVLRIEQDLSWGDIAHVMSGAEELDADTLARETARLRKRFQLLKKELRVQARAAGLTED